MASRGSAEAAIFALVLGLALVWPLHRLFAGSEVLDLRVYLSGGRAVLRGQDLYGTDVRIGRYGFTYPPFAAALFAILTPMPFRVAVLLMTLASLTALVVLIRLSGHLARGLSRDRSVAALLTVVAMVACQPVTTNMWNGQINLVLAALVMIDLVGSRRTRFGGALVGVAAAIKLTPAIFIAYLLVSRRFREAAHAGIAFVATTGLAWLVLPRDSLEYWTGTLYGGSGIGDLSKISNQSLLGVAERTFGAAAAVPIWLSSIVPVTALGLTLARRVSSTGREWFAVAIVGVTGCLVSPVSWSHHWVWFVPWLAGLVASARTRGLPSQVAATAFGVYLVGINAVPQATIDGNGPLRLFVENSYGLSAAVACVFACTRTASIGVLSGQRGAPTPQAHLSA